jgi:hypothetical protein
MNFRVCAAECAMIISNDKSSEKYEIQNTQKHWKKKIHIIQKMDAHAHQPQA